MWMSLDLFFYCCISCIYIYCTASSGWNFWLSNTDWSVTQVTCQLPSRWFLVTPPFPRCPGWRLKMPENWLQSHLWDYRSQPSLILLQKPLSLSLSPSLCWAKVVQLFLVVTRVTGFLHYKFHRGPKKWLAQTAQSGLFSVLALSQHWTN